MPDSLLLLAFALTLILNAALILVAIRAMREGPSDVARDEPAPGYREADVAVVREPAWHEVGRVDHREPPPTAEPWLPASLPSVPVARRPNAPSARSVVRPGPAVTGQGGDDTSGHRSEPATDEAQRSGSQTSVPPAADVPTRRRRRSKSPDAAVSDRPAPTAPTAPKSRSTGGRRRRFSLPPLDDDGDRVNRSIETFLSSGDATATDDTPPPPGRSDGQPPTTVALVAVVEAPAADAPGVAEPLRGERAPARLEDALVAVERSLRAAARTTDRVEPVSNGRFRVVLASTGELAARAYLRRVRSTVEPHLDQLVPRRRLAVATATILGESLAEADELAERRLGAILATHDQGDDDDLDESRAAPD